ncbi:MAG TPA: hypothetical protein VHO68_00055, partial [Bacteroidales bacterium]|nr:hypothetical protein [Bacteroidales bacterium]
MKSCFAIVILYLATALCGLSQNVHTSSNKAMKAYTDGLRDFDFLNFPSAETNFRQAVLIDGKFIEAYLMLGDLFTKQRRFAEAASNYRSVVRIDSLFYKPVFFTLANAEMNSGDYSKALVHYKVYLAQDGMSEKNRHVAEKNVKNCEFAIEAIKNPVPFSPESVGDGINTTDDEYWPSITADGETLIFTKQQRAGDNSLSQQEDFYISVYQNNSWQKAVSAGYPLNTRQNEGAQSLSSDGKYMYFTACDRQGGMGSCDIYYSQMSEGKWSEPVNLRSPVNTSAWESQPSVSADGMTLFHDSTIDIKSTHSHSPIGSKIEGLPVEMNKGRHFISRRIYRFAQVNRFCPGFVGIHSCEPYIFSSKS